MNIYKKFQALLSQQYRRQIIILFVLMIVGMFLETIGIGVVIPVLAFMTKVNISESYPSLHTWLVFAGNPTQSEIIVFGMLSLVVLYVMKSIFLSLLVLKQNRFVSNLSAYLSSKLFNGYLRQPWTFHLQRNSAQLILNVSNEIGLFSSSVESCIRLATDCLVLFGIVVLLSVVEPLGTFFVSGILGVVVWIFHRVMKSRLNIWGTLRQHHNEYSIQHLQQGFGGAKDIKLLGRENNFSEQYNFHNVIVANITSKIKALTDFIRLWLELIGMICLAFLVIIMIMHGTRVDLLLPQMGVFAAAAFKFLPSVNRITGALQNMRYLLPAINKVYEEMQLVDNRAFLQGGIPFIFKNNILLSYVDYKYKNANTHALKSVNIKIQRGTSVGFLGTSGAGKSTLVDIILGLLPPSNGVVTVDGINIQDNLRGWQNQIGYVPQSIFLMDDTIYRNIAFGLRDDEIDENAVTRALKAAQLEDFVNSLSDGINTMIGERGVRLSGGQRQRIGIARALYHDPDVLVLDEATSSLDLRTEKDVMSAVNKMHGDKTLLIVAHRLSTLSNCDVLYKLSSGRVIQEGNFECMTAGA